MALKPAGAYTVWATRIMECTHAALQKSDMAESKGWVTNALKGEYGHLIGAGVNVAYPTTNGHEAYRVVAATLDRTGAVVFVAHKTEAILNQLSLITQNMFVDDDEHNHYAAWY